MDLINKFGVEFPDQSSQRLPSCKSINEPKAGLFIANDNMKLAGWRLEAEDVGEHWELKTATEDPITKQFRTIPGRLIVSPRLLVLRGQMLKMNVVTHYCEGLWKKDDSVPREDRKAYCCKRFLIYFVDSDGIPYHSEPIQLTAKGNFMYNFDKKFNEYVMKMMGANGMKVPDRLYLAKDSIERQLWFAANCVFEPVFQSQIVGGPGKKATACITTDFGPGALNKATEEYQQVFKDTCGWWKKAVKSGLEQSPTTADSEETIVYEEVNY